MKELSGFYGFLLKIPAVGEELDRVYYFLVIEKHASDFTSCFAILFGDDWVDGIADNLTTLGRIKSHQALNFLIHGLLLVHLWLLLLLHHNIRLSLLSCLHATVRPIVISLLSPHLVALSTPTAVIIVELTTLAITGLSLITILTRVATMLSVALILLIVLRTLRTREHTSEEVLLNFVEAALLTLLLQLLCWHPKLNGEWSAAERC